MFTTIKQVAKINRRKGRRVKKKPQLLLLGGKQTRNWLRRVNVGSGERWPILNKIQKLIGWVLRGKESATINLQGLPAITFAVRQRFPSLTLSLSLSPPHLLVLLLPLLLPITYRRSFFLLTVQILFLYIFFG